MIISQQLKTPLKMLVIAAGLLLSLLELKAQEKLKFTSIISQQSCKASMSEDGRIIVYEPSHTEPPKVVVGINNNGGKLWNYSHMQVDFENHTDHQVLALCRLNDEPWAVGGGLAEAKSIYTVQTIIYRDTIPSLLDSLFRGMNGMPGGLIQLGSPDFNPEKFDRISLVFPFLQPGDSVSIFNARLIGDFGDFETANYLPLIDQFGQVVPADFTDKIKQESDLLSAKEKEQLQPTTTYPDRNQYGGWDEGSILGATGHFRVDKYNDQWWIIDPEGKLFWSYGVNCVNDDAFTPITDREYLFDSLPSIELASGQLYHQRQSAPKGYYKNKESTMVNFFGWNLLRKYGDNYTQQFADVTHKRLRRWGMNTIGNWSDSEIYLQQKTPYVGKISTESEPIHNANGQWGHFPDPYHPSFEQNLREAMKREQQKGTTQDPYLIGYFVDNELTWKNNLYLGLAVVSGAESPARDAWAKHLRTQYASIRLLNKAWDTNYKSWESAISEQNITVIPDQDISSFTAILAHKYFSTIQSVLKEFAPDKMYLGCRFDFHFYPNEDTAGIWVIKIASQYCDVISFNRYRYSAEDLMLPDQIDKPIIIGEFHINIIADGYLHCGLRCAKTQEERSQLIAYYLESAIKNPQIVGAHWFQYLDQPPSGRFDGENFHTGFISITDTPHPDIIKMSQEISSKMYFWRMGE